MRKSSQVRSVRERRAVTHGVDLMKRRERGHIVGAYVRSRLSLECQVRGRMSQLAEKTGFAAQYISMICGGRRTVGPGLARAMAEVWGMSYEALEKLAFETHGLPYAPEPVVRDLPNLRETVQWYREGKMCPTRFLRSYEARAEKLGIDRTRREWMRDLESEFEVWEAERKATLAMKQAARKSRHGVRSREERSGEHEIAGASDARALKLRPKRRTAS